MVIILPKQMVKRRRLCNTVEWCYQCKCSFCGIEWLVPKGNYNKINSCGCQKKITNHEGKRIGKLTVLKRLYGIQWLCLCDCGKKCLADTGKLTRGENTIDAVTSCGCSWQEKCTTHGMSKHPLYHTWCQMMRRCYSQKDQDYHRYGGLGIGVHPDWHDVSVFCNSMPPKPAPDMTLDRIESDGDYEPTNVKWSTPEEQLRNRGVTNKYDWLGEQLSLREIMNREGCYFPMSTVIGRIKNGYSVEEAITKEIK